jgi:hypothetical protein
MPLKTNVGVSRKIADNNYGSRGASVNLEVELDSSLIQEPERLQERIRQVFRMAQQSVDEELSRQNTANSHDNSHPAANGHGNGHHNGNGRNNGNGNGHAAPRRSNGRRATTSQARALRAIADRQGLDLAAELQHRFGVNDPEELSITEASQLIDELKSATNGHGTGR